MFMTVLSSSVLILLLLALRPFIKKRFSPVIQYALWALVVLRLLNPFQLWQSPLSLENLTLREPAPVVEPQNPPVQNFDSAPVGQPQEVTPNVGAIPDSPIGNIPQTSKPMSDTKDPLQTDTVQKLSLTTEEILNSLWFMGCVGMALWFLGVNVSFARKAKKGARKVEIPVAALPVYESEHIPSPCLLGLIKPRIYVLPCEEPTARKHILAHEETHYRHWDHVWSLIRSLCLCIYWFNPLVWVAAYLSKEDCEAACDQGAISTLGEEERILYGKTLLHTLAQVNRPGNLLRSATTMAGGKQQIRNRLERIVSRPKKALWAVLMLVLVLCISVGCTFTSASETDLPDQEATQPTTEDQAKLPSEELPVVDATPEATTETTEEAPTESEPAPTETTDPSRVSVDTQVDFTPTGEVTPNVVDAVNETYELYGNVHSRVLPRIELPGPNVEAINAEILRDYTSDFYTTNYMDIYYKWAVKDDILSVVIFCGESMFDGGWEGYGVDAFSVYNISISKCRLLSDQEVYAMSGMDQPEEQVLNAIVRYGAEWKGRTEDGQMIFFGSANHPLTIDSMTRELSHENFLDARPYFDENGNLWVMGHVITNIGAGGFYGFVPVYAYEFHSLLTPAEYYSEYYQLYAQ